jgi:hypothetical protein
MLSKECPQNSVDKHNLCAFLYSALTVVLTYRYYNLETSRVGKAANIKNSIGTLGVWEMGSKGSEPYRAGMSTS